MRSPYDMKKKHDTKNPSGDFMQSHVNDYLSKLTDGVGVTKFDIFKDIPYGSEKHAAIAERYIENLAPLIRRFVDTNEEEPSEPYVHANVISKIRTRMDKTYHAGEPFKALDNDEDIYKCVDEVCKMVEDNPNIQKYTDTAVVKRGSIMGYPAYTKDMEEKLSWLQYAAYFIRNGFKNDDKVRFDAVFTTFFRRQWKSVSNKKIQVDGKMIEVDRKLSDGWLLARNRQVFGGDPVNVAKSLAAQSCQHAVYEVFGDFIDISTSGEWYEVQDGYALALDLPQMDRLFSHKIFRRIAECMEKLTGLKGWADYICSAVAIYKDADGKIRITIDLANPSGQATVTLTNFMLGLGINLYILRKVWPDFRYQQYTKHIKKLKNKGDDTLLSFYTGQDRSRYSDVLSSMDKEGAAIVFKKEIPPAMLGYLAYTPEKGKFYMDYNYTNIAAGLCQKEKQNTDYFYISWLAKKQILNRNSVGKEIMSIFNQSFKQVIGVSYDDYVTMNMTQEERRMLNGINENDINITNLLVMIKPEMALYKFKLSDISKEVLDEYYISFTGDEVYDLLHGSKGDIDIDETTSISMLRMPTVDELVNNYNRNVSKQYTDDRRQSQYVDDIYNDDATIN